MNNEIVDRIELICVPVFDLYFRRKRCNVFAILSVDFCQEWAAFDQSRLKVGHSQAFVGVVMCIKYWGCFGYETVADVPES